MRCGLNVHQADEGFANGGRQTLYFDLCLDAAADARKFVTN
jgi:hypothetical protein